MSALKFKEIRQNYPLSLLLTALPDVKKLEKYLNKGRCFGAYDENETLNGVYVIKDLKDGSVELAAVCVAEDFRGKGMARIIIQDAKARAKDEKFTRLVTFAENDEQQKFALACGFTVCAEKENEPNPTPDLVRFEMKIA